MRVGVFGGSFDPVHWAHLVIAEQAREQVALDRVLFVPAARPPHKQTQPLSTFAHRATMLRLAIAGHLAFEVSEVEKDRPGPSYTVATLEDLRRCHPEADLFLILGGDSLRDFPNWREPERIASMATLVAAPRPGYLVQSLPNWVRLQEIQVPLLEISSTDIRKRVASGRSIRYLVPRAVECYIEAHGLYRNTPAV
ncbi:MAG: nicotinic acid mononucleotide adenylyltransferase [Gemmataceae bacterium]